MTWLPPGFAFLSGFPTVARKRRILLPMQALIDDSGGKGEGDTFVLAGFIGRSEAWADFVDRWQAALDRDRGIPYFKFRDFSHRGGVFTQFSEEERRKKASDLVAAMAGGGFERVSITLDLKAFAERYGVSWEGLDIGHPYVWTFQMMIGAVAITLFHGGHRESFDIIFDEQSSFAAKCKKWYRAIKEICVPPQLQPLLPTEPIFRDDREFLALQASDLYAGLVRSAKGHDAEADLDGYGWLRKELASVTTISGCSQKVGRAMLSNQTKSSTPMGEKEATRAIALMDEDGLDAYRRRIEKRRKKAAKKESRHK
jgi:hypothetical protein